MPWRQLHQTQCPSINCWYFWCLQMVKRTWSSFLPCFFPLFSGIFEHLWLGLCPVHSKLRVLQHDAWFPMVLQKQTDFPCWSDWGSTHLVPSMQPSRRLNALACRQQKRLSAMAVSRFMDRSGHSIAHRIRHLAVFVRLAWFHIGKIRKFRSDFRMQICLSFCRQKFETTPSSSTCLQAGACFLKEK